MHLILNLATGGVFVDGVLPLDEDLPAALEVDYVRVYARENYYRVYLPEVVR